MPWLNLWTKKKLDLCRILCGDIGKYRTVEGAEHFGGEGAYVVEVELDGVDGFWRDMSGVGLAGEFWSECHPDGKFPWAVVERSLDSREM